MKSLFSRRPHLILVVLGTYFLLHLIVRLSIPNALELDEAEQMLLSQWFAFGYNSQPPFYNWLQYGVTSLIGVSMFSLSLLKCSMLFLSYVFYWLTARLILKNSGLVVVATLGLLTVPQIVFEAQRDLTHSVATIFSGSLFLYGFFRTLRTPSAISYAIVGIATGIGVISKYNFALLPAAALVAALIDTDFRKRIFDWRLALTIVLSIAIVLPHALWFLQHFDLAVDRTLHKMTGAGEGFLAQVATGFFRFISAMVGIAGVSIVIFLVLFAKSLRAMRRASSRWTRIAGRILLIEIGAIALMILLAGVDNVADRWLTPLFLILPLYICMKADSAEVDAGAPLRKSLAVSGVIMGVVLAVLAMRAYWGPLIGDYQRLNIPYDSFAETIRRDIGGEPGLIVGYDPHLDGNMRLQMPDVPVQSYFYPDFKPKFQLDAKHPVVFVWRDDKGGAPPAWPDYYFKDVIAQNGLKQPETHIVALPYIYGQPGDTYQFAYAVAYP
ncbi:glycosyltransferase family 39 protein [Rhizobium viscosum]|uniref:4-amino-4-deoxy-L-arabinose transferase-like glycosyltransferase n=1 Tax=Rhizobium viscosum TaxID=1673 RepID=A0ABR9IJZ8_RHIVS|nr:glycosyltransferase family 39 protein [Rhizobium viscosum]MBE1503504.1 4-amino-4-deoxy-L-arabinose transferase-like glycosyltransferase [Rhizobium viscosum]